MTWPIRLLGALSELGDATITRRETSQIPFQRGCASHACVLLHLMHCQISLFALEVPIHVLQIMQSKLRQNKMDYKA